MSAGDDESATNEQYSDDDFLEAIEAGKKGTSDIADYVGCERRTADYRLKRLRDDGEVTSEEIGQTFIWSLVE